MNDESQFRSSLNQWWATWTLEELNRLGVKHVCLAPGSRSTPLTLAASNHSSLTIHTHFDERGLGFLALGLAKATQSPVAVIVTSGTAVANLLPAIAESGLTGEPLVILSSDRPVELIACGANQAIVQHGIFSSHVTAFYDIPTPSFSVSPAWLLTTIDEAMAKQRQLGGTIHFNCHYPEPLYGEKLPLLAYQAPISAWINGITPYCLYKHSELSCSLDVSDIQRLSHKKGVILVGKINGESQDSLIALSDALGWPMLADPQSGLSTSYAGFDGWLQNTACANIFDQAEVVLQFGARFVSKRLSQWLSTQALSEYWLVEPNVARLDPHHRASVRLCAAIQDVIVQFMVSIPQVPMQKNWAKDLIQASQWCLTELAQRSQTLSELAFAYHLHDALLPNTQLFMGNSLMVRFLDLCGNLPQGKRWANRGASGIDGLIATAAGVARATDDPLVIVLGDTSLLYDLNSLALLRQTRQPIVVVVTNNNGGGIFDLLPVPDQQKDDYYRLPHDLNFSSAASMFGLAYFAPTSLLAVLDAVKEGQGHNKTRLVEIITPAGEAGNQMQSLFQWVKNATLLS